MARTRQQSQQSKKENNTQNSKVQDPSIPGTPVQNGVRKSRAGQKKPRAATIREVAALANVSIATVSNVLDGKSTLYSSGTEQRVLEAVNTLDYRPNHTARSLVRRRTYTIGFAARWSASLIDNYYLSNVLGGFIDYARHHDYQTKIIAVDENDAARGIARIGDGSVDGVALVVPSSASPFVKWAEKSWVPTVSIGNLLEASISYVGVDDFTPFYEAAQWLLSLGHKRIGLIGGPLRQASGRERERAYRQAMEEAGIPPRKNWVFEGADYIASEGRRGAQQLLKLRPAITAIMCGSDLMALGAMEELQAAGVRVPEDVSLIGFDDITEAKLTQPRLTTIRQPILEIGAKAAELLINQIENENHEPQRVRFPGTLIERDSVAPPAK